MIMAFHLTGRYLEAKAKGATSRAVRDLLKLKPRTARLIVGNEEKEVPIREVKVGDILIVRPGEKIPTDGVIIEGESSVDESMLTGESVPTIKKPSDEVIDRSLNREGLLKIRVTKVGRDTFLAQVIKLVEVKVPIKELTDKVVRYFVPLVLLLAFISFTLWLLCPNVMKLATSNLQSIFPWVNLRQPPLTLAISAAIATLIMACPCAFGLATPTALMVGMGAKDGILIKRSRAI